MYPYNCEFCGKVKFAKYKSLTKRFCSHKCSITSRGKNGKRKKIKCQNCNESFELLESFAKAREKEGRIKFCSRNCYNEHREKRKNHKVIKCGFCEGDFYNDTGSRKYCSSKCACEDKKRKNTAGYWYENGYKVIYAGEGKGIKEHIKIMQEHIGRQLRKDEIVHHINEIKDDNRLENLQLMTRSEHSKLHRELELLKGKKLFTKDN